MPGVSVPTLEEFNSLVTRVQALEKPYTGPTGSTGPTGVTGPSGPSGTPTGPSRAFWKSGGNKNTNIGSSVAEWGTWRGRPCDFSIVYSTRTAGWGEFINSHFRSGQISTHTDKSLELLIQTAPFPSNGNYAALGRGDYDGYWQQIGTGLKAREDAGYHPVVISIAWEMNGTYMYWGGGGNPQNPGSKYINVAQYIAGYRFIVASLRKTYPDVRTAWIINAHSTPSAVGTTDAWALYPGSDVVTYVGIDVYDMYPPSKSEAAFEQQANANGGLKWLGTKAKSVGKQIIVGEWGINNNATNVSQGTGGGDNALFIRLQFETYKQLFEQGLLYAEFYFNDPKDGSNVDSDLLNANPNSSNEYRRLYRIT